MKWISIEDKRPKKGVPVLVYTHYQANFGSTDIGRYVGKGSGKYWFQFDLDNPIPAGGVTHWMPLPKSPLELPTPERSIARDGASSN